MRYLHRGARPSSASLQAGTGQAAPCKAFDTYRAYWRRTTRPRCFPAVTSADTVDKLLDSFWEARGVFDLDQRRKLVEMASSIKPVESTCIKDEEPLPGIPSTWQLDTSAPEVYEVSRRLVQLQSILGGQGDVDVTWMVVREPALLAADYNELMKRLLNMKIAATGSSIDVVKIAERQPSLLLQEDVDWDSTESLAQRLAAWEFGLVSDSDPEWCRRYDQLGEYKQQHGDASAGFRDGDDPDLARWATKQRAAWRRKELEAAKVSALESLGFVFDAEEAEWQRWFQQLYEFRAEHGHCSPMPLAAGDDFYLINWCSVQRIAMRSKVLSAKRIAQLDSIGFDWTGADPLS